jgi:hypothetical protein
MLNARSALVFAALWATSSVAIAVTLSPFNNFVFNSPIGIDFHEPSGQLLMSVNYPTGSPHNFDLVASSGTPTQFGAVAGLTEEVKIATVRAGAHQGGFAVGEAFSGNGVPGSVVRLHPDGTPFNPVFPYTWATLPGEPNLLRGSLFQDRFGVAGGDLIVVTGNEETGDPTNDLAGNVWRVNSLGVATMVASIGHHLEGVTTVPNDPLLYGPLAGKIIGGDEDFHTAPACTGTIDPSTCNGPEGKIWAVDPTTGNVFTIGGGAGSGTACVGSTGLPNGCHYHTAIHFNPEDLDIIRGNADFFGVAFRDGQVLTAPASDFAGLCGQVLITQEFPWTTANTGSINGTSGLSALSWNGSSFVVTPLASNRTVQQWEHTTFTSGQDCFGITVVKTPKDGSFTQGGQASFTMVVTATGVSADTNVVLTDQLPGNGGLVWTSATTSNGTPCTIVSNLLPCQHGTIQPGAANAVTIVVTTDTTTPTAACQSQPNPDAHVTADHGLVADDSGSLTCTPVRSTPLLNVVKTPDGGTFTQGAPVSFTIVVSSVGQANSVAHAVQLNDQLPTNGGLNWSGATVTTTQGSCSVSASSLLTCSMGDINAGASVTVTVSLSNPTRMPLQRARPTISSLRTPVR